VVDRQVGLPEVQGSRHYDVVGHDVHRDHVSDIFVVGSDPLHYS
jgi:hypothetical protein